MPIYVFKCKACSSVVEEKRDCGDITSPSCACGELMRHVFTPPSFIMKQGITQMSLKDLDQYGDPGDYATFD